MKRFFACAMITALFMSPSCQFTDALPTPPPPRVSKVVLVHGIFGKSKHFSTLKKHLERQGFECYAPELKPNNGQGGLEKPAQQLKQDIDAKFGPSTPINVVSFSMGGIISRKYLQDLGGAKRCANFITISSPHHGTFTAWLFPTLGAQQMRPHSEFLTELEKSESSLKKLTITSYRTPIDLVIVPPSSSIWKLAENRSQFALLHPFMLDSKQLIHDVAERLKK